jgi:Ca-activated chloride channel family protein
MSFGSPWMLLLLLLPLAGLIALRRFMKTRPRAQWPAMLRVAIVGKRLRLARPQSLRPALLTLCAIVVALIAAAQPRWGEQKEQLTVNTREVIIAMDVSRSMLTEDVAPSRLELARRISGDLLDSLKGESVGLVVFSGTSFVQVPLSPDYQIVREFLPILDPDYMPQGGTDYTAMLQSALEGFSDTPDIDRYLIVLSDGESSTDGWNAKLDALADKQVHVIALGMGTDEGGFLPDGQGGYLEDSNGNTVHSKLQPSTLQTLARRSNGEYRLGSTLPDVDAIRALLARTVETGKKGQSKKEASDVQKERFQWLLLPAILLALAGVLREFQQRPRPRAIEQQMYAPRGGKTLGGALALGATLIATLGFAPQTRAHFDNDAQFEVREVFDSNPSKRLRAITEHLAQYDYDAFDLRLMVEESIKYGIDQQRTDTEISEGVLRDAIEATYQGEKLDKSIADWSYYRSQLTTMLEPVEKQRVAEEASKAKKELLDEEDNPPITTGQSSQQAANDSFGQGASAKSDATLGDLADEQAQKSPRKKPPPPPKKPRAMTASNSRSGGNNGDSGDPILELSKKRLEAVTKQDSPGRLYQMMAESTAQQDSNQFDW